MRVIVAACLVAAAGACAAAPSQPDFSTTAGLERTCAASSSAGPAFGGGDRERVARFICGAVALAKDAATWFEHNPMRLDEPRSAWAAAARKRAERYLATQTFATWGDVLREFDAVLAGSALLGGRVDNGPRGGGLRDLSFGLCADGEGLDVRGLFMHPVPRIFDTQQLKARCAKPTPARPLTRLASIVQASLARSANGPAPGASGEAALLRHLYWVN